MTDLPVLPALKPIAKCGLCNADLYAGDDTCLAKPWPRRECPVRSYEWFKLRHGMMLESQP